MGEQHIQWKGRLLNPQAWAKLGKRRVCWSYNQVEGEAQGDDSSIQKLLKDLKQGPSAAHVVKVDKSETEIKEGESSFQAK